MTDPPRDTSTTRRARLLAVAGLGLEGLGLVFLVVLAVQSDLAGTVSNTRAAWGVTAFFAVAAIGVAGILVAVLKRRRRAAAPGITVQLLVLFVVAWPEITGGNTVIGVVAAVVAVVTAVALVVQSRALPAPSF